MAAPKGAFQIRRKDSNGNGGPIGKGEGRESVRSRFSEAEFPGPASAGERSESFLPNQWPKDLRGGYAWGYSS